MTSWFLKGNYNRIEEDDIGMKRHLKVFVQVRTRTISPVLGVNLWKMTNWHKGM